MARRAIHHQCDGIGTGFAEGVRRRFQRRERVVAEIPRPLFTKVAAIGKCDRLPRSGLRGRIAEIDSLLLARITECEDKYQ